VHDAAVVPGLVAADRDLLIDDNDRRLRPAPPQLPGRRQPDDASADNNNSVLCQRTSTRKPTMTSARPAPDIGFDHLDGTVPPAPFDRIERNPIRRPVWAGADG
jgi:hypothetical protein